jgi:hypothetical protein
MCQRENQPRGRRNQVALLERAPDSFPVLTRSLGQQGALQHLVSHLLDRLTIADCRENTGGFVDQRPLGAVSSAVRAAIPNDDRMPVMFGLNVSISGHAYVALGMCDGIHVRLQHLKMTA